MCENIGSIVYEMRLLGYDFFTDGTGSYPQDPAGWHFKIRRTAKETPLKTPCVSIASRAYWEHDGLCRQAEGKMGEMTIR